MSDGLKVLVQKLAGTWGKANFKTFDANVISVDTDSRTCVVNSLDHSINKLTVRFMPVESDGDMSVPQIDSIVIVAMTDFTEPYIVSATWLNQKIFVVGNQSLDIQPTKTIFNDGACGGIPIVKDPDNANHGLLKKYNNIEQKINDLIQVFSTWTPVPNDGGAALKTALTSWVAATLTPTQEADISNPNITHGKKFV